MRMDIPSNYHLIKGKNIMKKHSSKKSHLKQNTKIAIAATMLAVPMLYSPSTIIAQEKKSIESPNPDSYLKFANLFLKYKFTDVFTTVAFSNNHTIYKNKNGECFWVDPNNGDFKFLPKDWDKKEKYFTIKLSTKVTLLGFDSKGNLIQTNGKEKFYIDKNTHNQVFVK